MSIDCAHTLEVTAWLQGELADDEARRLHEHVRRCEVCSETVASHRALLARLRAEPGVHAPAALADRAWHTSGRRPRRPPRRLVAALPRLSLAAAALVAATLWVFATSTGHPSGSTAPRVGTGAAARLEAELAPDGTWIDADPTSMGIAEHAFHVLALASVQRDAPEPGRRDRLLSAARRLIEAQDATGFVGRPLADRTFDHAVATAALLDVADVTRDEPTRTAARAAVAHIVATLDASPSLLDRSPGQPRSLRTWVRTALAHASRQGLVDADGTIASPATTHATGDVSFASLVSAFGPSASRGGPLATASFDILSSRRLD